MNQVKEVSQGKSPTRIISFKSQSNDSESLFSHSVIISRAASAARNIELFIQIIEALWKMGTREIWFRLKWQMWNRVRIEKTDSEETPSHLPISTALYNGCPYFDRLKVKVKVKSESGKLELKRRIVKETLLSIMAAVHLLNK